MYRFPSADYATRSMCAVDGLLVDVRLVAVGRCSPGRRSLTPPGEYLTGRE